MSGAVRYRPLNSACPSASNQDYNAIVDPAGQRVAKHLRCWLRRVGAVAVIALLLSLVAFPYVGTTIDLYNRHGGQQAQIDALNMTQSIQTAQLYEVLMNTGLTLNVTIEQEGTFLWEIYGSTAAERSNYTLESITIGSSALTFRVLIIPSQPEPAIAFPALSDGQFRLIDFDPPLVPLTGVFSESHGSYVHPLTLANIGRIVTSPSGYFVSATTGDQTSRNAIQFRTLDPLDPAAALFQGYIREGPPDGTIFTLSEPWQLIFYSA